MLHLRLHFRLVHLHSGRDSHIVGHQDRGVIATDVCKASSTTVDYAVVAVVRNPGRPRIIARQTRQFSKRRGLSSTK